MPMDGLMLGFIARELNALLLGGRVDKIAQPEKDEIILHVRAGGVNRQLLLSASAHHARAHVTGVKKTNPLDPPMFCMLLRKHLSGGRLLGVRQIAGDRILQFDVESTDELGDRTVKRLICEIMGKHSNLILVHPNGRIIDSAKHVTEEISRVRDVLPGIPYEDPPEQYKLNYAELAPEALAARLRESAGPLSKALLSHISGLSPQTARELSYRVALGDPPVESLNISQCAERAAEILREWTQQVKPTLLLKDDGSPLDVTPFPYQTLEGASTQYYPTLSEALDAYYFERDRFERIKQKSSTLHRVLKNNIERCEKKLAIQYDALEDSARMEEYRIKGELLTASLHAVKKGQKQAALINYYDPECAEILVPLDERLSPGQNAQRYFKLYQKARSAQKLAAEQIERTREELNYLEGQFDNLQKCVEEAELSEIREELERLGYVRKNHNRREMKKLPPSKPLHYRSSNGIDILIGKNNLQNDKLTQSANPDEYWLHAKDIPGSHVIVVSDRPDPETLTEAATLAAYYSKARASSQVPVDMTRRRYVKKPSGAKPGFVIYTHQQTLYVTPTETVSSLQQID